ncbi:MAPEG family protein [marine gamma proteobacterium HTCC2143]|jgi:glutathione S-transferase|uniref:MAPEG family protein n=1 Tax=marine gamma proteobacterium HTCC2143 TaxID=247633 RepID=A0Y930_9GAMM|nr:MAPEG family protein [marine gamma proteobacterium HTCC2143]
MDLIATVAGLMLLEYFVFAMLVGAVRGKTGIDAPATTGDPRLERMLRVQMNTLEQLIVALPAMWIFGTYISSTWGAALGLVFIIGRVIYCVGYLSDPKKRAPGFMIGFLATLVLMVGGLYGAVMAVLQ